MALTQHRAGSGYHGQLLFRDLLRGERVIGKGRKATVRREQDPFLAEELNRALAFAQDVMESVPIRGA